MMTVLKSLVKKIPVSAEKKTKQKDYLQEGTLAIIDQGKEFIGGYTNNMDKQVNCSLPVIVFGDHTRVIKYINFPFGAGADGIKVLKPNDSILPKFLYYGMQYLVHKTPDKGYARQYQYLEKEKLNVPSLSEQRRIVSRIEELLSQLESGVETLNTVKRQLAAYRQAVLQEAFFSQASDLVELSQLVDDIRIGPFGTMLHKEDYILNGIPVINPQHIKKLAICESPRVTISAEKADELAAYKLQLNDVIMGRRGEMGRVAAVGEREKGWICGTGSILFRLKPEFDANLYVQILSSPKTVHYLEKHATGTTMKNLNEDIVKHIPVPRIDRAEQASIIQRTDSALSVCDNIEQTVNDALRQSEAMRKSILKRAFEGEL